MPVPPVQRKTLVKTLHSSAGMRRSHRKKDAGNASNSPLCSSAVIVLLKSGICGLRDGSNFCLLLPYSPSNAGRCAADCVDQNEPDLAVRFAYAERIHCCHFLLNEVFHKGRLTDNGVQSASGITRLAILRHVIDNTLEETVEMIVLVLTDVRVLVNALLVVLFQIRA